MAIINNTGFDFLSRDEMGDCLAIKKHENYTTISVQNENSEKVHCVTSLDENDMRALRDWLNRNFPNA